MESGSGVIITVFSTASAVGKTFLATNLAAVLGSAGYRVCLMDLDLQFGDVCNYLAIDPGKTLFDAQRDVADDTEGFDPLPYLVDYQCQDTSISVLAAPKLLEEAYNVDTDAVVEVTRKLAKEFDYIVVDMAPAFSELNLAILDITTIVTFVGIVDFIPTIKNMKSGWDTLKMIGYDGNRIRFVLNRGGSQTRIGLDEVEQILGSPFYHILPNDFRAASQSIKEGIPLVLKNDTTALSEALCDLVARYTNSGGYNETDKADIVDDVSGDGSWLHRLFH